MSSSLGSKRTRLVLATGAVMLAALAVVLFGAVSEDRAGAAVASAAVTTVAVDDDLFAPTAVKIKRGDKVRWRSAKSGSLGTATTNAHNVWVTSLPKALKRKKAKFRTYLPSTRLDWTRRFTVRGRYTFICIPHKNDMRMSVTVK